jgi:hypothetical protein
MMSPSGIPTAAAMPGTTVVFTTMTVPVATITMPIHSAEATTHTKSKHRATTVIPRRSGIDRFVTRIITIAVTHWAA